jgi:hypothetical protein
MRPCISGFLGIGESYSRLPMEGPEVTVAGWGSRFIVSGERDQDPAISSDDHRGISLVVGLLD